MKNTIFGIIVAGAALIAQAIAQEEEPHQLSPTPIPDWYLDDVDQEYAGKEVDNGYLRGN